VGDAWQAAAKHVLVTGGVSMVCLLAAAPARAQRAGDNVLTSAGDAFGTSLGRENFGIYTANQVRGFSPTVAGNSRIMGLYFDQIGMTSRAIRLGSTVKVGLGTLASPFPAPTGVVDLSLRVPGQKGLGSATIGIQEVYKASSDFEKELPLSPRFGMTVGGVFEVHNIVSGDRGRNWGLGVTGRWEPFDGVELVPFFGGFSRYNELPIDQRWFTRDRRQPLQRVNRLRAIGPLWAGNTDTPMNGGMVAKISALEGWDIEAGLFRSSLIRQRTHVILPRDIDENGEGDRIIVADPRTLRVSWSGELQVARTLRTGPLDHKLIASVRGRNVFARIGGSDRVNLGRFGLDERVDLPRPDFNFSPQTIDTVQQRGLGLGYEGRWGGVAEAAAGVQFVDYKKRIDQPGLPLFEQREKLVLPNGIVAINATSGLVIYGAFTQGLEEIAAPPPEAVNRNDLLPAQLTEQMEAGVRITLPARLKLNASAFRIEKPLFALDDALVFRQRGTVRHQGLEASLAGSPIEGLTVLMGVLWLDARNSGEDVENGSLGERPVGQPGVSGRLAANWRPDGGRSPWSFDIVVDAEGPAQATRDNLVQSVALLNVDIGGRYRFKLKGHDATVRVQLTEVSNSFRWEIAGDGAWQTSRPRTVVAFLTVNI
jgi:iron complex outermembrane receptor protein